MLIQSPYWLTQQKLWDAQNPSSRLPGLTLHLHAKVQVTYLVHFIAFCSCQKVHVAVKRSTRLAPVPNLAWLWHNSPLLLWTLRSREGISSITQSGGRGSCFHSFPFLMRFQKKGKICRCPQKDEELVCKIRQLVWSINESVCTLNHDAWMLHYSTRERDVWHICKTWIQQPWL